MTSDRSRRRTRLRATLAGTAVVIATVLAVIGGYVRAPNALVGAVLARAYTAERDAAERRQPRLRVDGEDAHVEDADDGLVPSIHAAKTSPPPRERGSEPGLHVAAISARAWSAPDVVPPLGPGLDVVPAGPPTRKCARLMVFLN